ncbi:MAG: hypothetical protein KME08_16660 [Aphanothece sp. CMT-3BRIN-NPC111]|nr:hypothetical protein [Aphanothece sp. CMT-3BRIN-NPC111]
MVFAEPIPQNPQPIGENPIQYIENPAPELLGNQPLPESQLISRETILSQTKIPSRGKLISLNLKMWQQHLSEQGDMKGASPLVAGDRQVWELKIFYPEYQHFRLGLVKNATTTQAFDAETGKLLHQKTEGSFSGHPAQFQ